MTDITRDNSHYRSPAVPSELRRFEDLQLIANDIVIPEEVRHFVTSSIALSTRKAYRSDLKMFARWGGSVPATSSMIALYLAEHATFRSVATLQRWASSLSRAHTSMGLADPTKAEPARSTMKGIRRLHGVAVRAAAPLMHDDLLCALEMLGKSARDTRDRSLLLIGFAGGLRRSEIIGLNVDDIKSDARGLIVKIRRSKTDQEGRGREIAIPLGRTHHCPVSALHDWITLAELREGPIFRSIKRNCKISPDRLSGEAVSKIVKERVSAIGKDPNHFSGHSLRAGFATSAALLGVSSWKIREQTGHKSDAMLSRYIRSAELFNGNAAGLLF